MSGKVARRLRKEAHAESTITKKARIIYLLKKKNYEHKN
jgi:hypothetical protein